MIFFFYNYHLYFLYFNLIFLIYKNLCYVINNKNLKQIKFYFELEILYLTKINQYFIFILLIKSDKSIKYGKQ